MTAHSIATELQEENAKLREKVAYLEEQIEWFKRQIFGKRSEKIITGTSKEIQLFLPGLEMHEQPKQTPSRTIPAHERRKPSRDGRDSITLPDDLPVEKQIVDIPAEDKICKITGQALVKIGEEVTKKLAFKPGSYFIKEIIRPKYASPAVPEAGVQIAMLPPSLLDRCQADESFLADLLTKKFCDHLPLYRQAEMLSRDGIAVSRQVLCQWVIRAAKALKPLRDCMVQQILKSGNVFIDETPIKMLAPGNGQTKQAYMWVMVGGTCADPPYRVYEFYENRKHSNAEKLLQGYTEVLHSDKYGAYESLANAKQFIWTPCWGHVRRKFVEAETGDPPFRAWVLRKIRHLFMLEKVAWTRSLEERLKIRQEREVPIIDELTARMKAKLLDGKILPKSKLKEAIGYYMGLAAHLKNYTNHAFARLDNNVAERAVRPVAIGRKNWLFVGNAEGGEAAATIFSLTQTCRALNINPRDYLEDVMRRLMDHPASKLHELLPDQWAIARGIIPPS
jgi:transposase